MKNWFRRNHSLGFDLEIQPGRWPIACCDTRSIKLGPALAACNYDDRTTPAQTTEIFLTYRGLQRPMLVLGANAAGNSRTVVRLICRAMEEIDRTIIYVHDEANPGLDRQVSSLMRMMGRSPVSWTPTGTIRANWLAAQDTMLHHSLRELLSDTPVMQYDDNLVDLVLHALLRLSPEPLRDVDDLIARCRTLYAYVAQMQGDAAGTASRLCSLTTLPLYPTDEDEDAILTSDAEATRQRLLDWTVKTDLKLVEMIRDRIEERLSALAPVLGSEGWCVSSVKAATITLPTRNTAVERARRRFILDAIMHATVRYASPHYPITLVLDGVRELREYELQRPAQSDIRNLRCLRDRLDVLPLLCRRGLSTIITAPGSTCLTPELSQRMLAFDPLVVVHATDRDEPLLETLSSQTAYPSPARQRPHNGNGNGNGNGHGDVRICGTSSFPSVLAGGARNLSADEAYLLVDRQTTLARIVPVQLPAKDTLLLLLPAAGAAGPDGMRDSRG